MKWHLVVTLGVEIGPHSIADPGIDPLGLFSSPSRKKRTIDRFKFPPVEFVIFKISTKNLLGGGARSEEEKERKEKEKRRRITFLSIKF